MRAGWGGLPSPAKMRFVAWRGIMGWDGTDGWLEIRHLTSPAMLPMLFGIMQARRIVK